MKGYFDKHIRNRFFWAAKLRSSQDFSDVTRQEIFPPLPVPRRRMPHPQRVEIMLCRGMRETQRVLIVPRSQYILTRHTPDIPFVGIRKTRRVGLFHGCGMYKTRRVRGMPLGEIRKTGCLLGMLWGGRWKMWRVFMPLGRGVWHTPYRRPIYGANDPNDRSPMRILVPCGAILWGVCNTPLP